MPESCGEAASTAGHEAKLQGGKRLRQELCSWVEGNAADRLCGPTRRARWVCDRALFSSDRQAASRAPIVKRSVCVPGPLIRLGIAAANPAVSPFIEQRILAREPGLEDRLAALEPLEPAAFVAVRKAAPRR